MTNHYPSEPQQVDLEEYIAEKSGKPYRAWGAKPQREETYETTASQYKPLKDVLKAAYDQAASGKGKDRHANGKVFRATDLGDRQDGGHGIPDRAGHEEVSRGWRYGLTG